MDNLTSLYRELKELLNSGQWNEEAYKRLLAKAIPLVGEQGDSLEFIEMHAHPDWQQDFNHRTV